MTANAVWNRNQQPTNRTADELLVFGYSCKIFRDDEKAIFIDEGKHLIPWMGDDAVMIDRYDVRGYLHDLAPYEAKTDYELDKDVAEEEILCEEERYLALHSDVSEEELYHEEEMKRLRAAVACDGAYHEIGFSYDSVENISEQAQLPLNKDIEPIEEPYIIPEGLSIPKGMQVPSNMKIHAIIEKTAFFISQQGGQMEVIIRMKQSDNPQFAFMCFDNPLHPYYKFLVQELKAGRYKPIIEKKSNESDDEYHDGHYLHPSLVSRKTEDIPKFTIPSINFLRTGSDSYSLLVKNLKPRIEEETQRNSPNTYLDTGSPLPSGAKSESSTSDSDDSSDSEGGLLDQHRVPPPPDIQPIIDKMAEYVAKNGEDFETIVKSRNDKRFDFLNQGNKYYSYYLSQRNCAAQRISRMSERALPQSLREHVSPSEEPVQSQVVPVYSEVIESKLPAQSSPLPSLTQTCISDYSQESYSPDDSKISPSIGDAENPKIIQICSSMYVSPETQSPKSINDYEPDTTDTVKSSGSETPPKEVKVKMRTPKGPISFSLKGKEFEPQALEKSIKRAPVLLDDSEGDEEKNEEDHKIESDRRRKVSKDNVASSRSRKMSSIANEDKPKKPSAEELEAKLAEEKIKTKIMAAAREKLVQQKRDRQLQLERKQKAAVFLKMLQEKKLKDANMIDSAHNDKLAKSSAIVESNKNGSSPSSPSMSDIISPDRKEAITSFPPSPLLSFHHGKSWSPASDSGLSETGNVGTTNERLKGNAQDPSTAKEELKAKEKTSQSTEKSHKSQSKSHKSSKSKKRKRSRSHSNSRRRHKARTPPRKEKKLPSAYAIERRSRSKSRSPRRHNFISRQRSPLHWSRHRP